jgi:hypothetical protein
LIDVRHDHVLAAANGPRQNSVAGLDALDDPLTIIGGPEQNAITRGDDVPLVRREGAQQTACGTLKECPVGGGNGA